MSRAHRALVLALSAVRGSICKLNAGALASAAPLRLADGAVAQKTAARQGAIGQVGRKDRFEAYRNRLFGYAFALSKDVELAGELVQDCAIKALSALSPPTDEAAYRAWLFRIARNLYVDRLRRQKTERTAQEDFEPPMGQPLNLENAVVNALSVRQGLLRLSQTQREIIVLVDVAGFSYAEAAEVLGVPAGTVMSRLSRARQALIAQLSDDKVVPLRPRGGRPKGKQRLE